MYLTTTGTPTRESMKAVLVSFGDRELWLPKSEIAIGRFHNDPPMLLVKSWLSTKLDLKGCYVPNAMDKLKFNMEIFDDITNACTR